eukprot:CAMPEP_0201718838 /NCGR_PEP_ID=MMETSP0593-20130828/4275_1 /ASSEMBLY_ACC=CAM_ASM_000672 /TAXON_ID=267983 /ORGANISM="Skeletonema japonicum, Strain CCMP2506" /LENGTH=328 /DNA_ID=CAMNT_0048209225 /DNA_START=14 /DNA_END=1000 /DNA_ORIENTATION=-
MTAPPSPATAHSSYEDQQRQKRRRAAFLSYGLDILNCTAVILLLFCWLSDMNHFNPTTTTTAGSNANNDNVDSLLFLSKSFLTNGFCLAPKIFDNTHFSCAAFDFFCACICILAILLAKQRSNNNKKDKSKILPGNVIYFLAHAYGHYKFSTVVNTSDWEESTAEKIQSAITLSFILSIGPLNAASVLIKAKKLSPPHAYIMAGSIVTILVGVYYFILNHPSYALLYINISIILSISLPKLLFVKYTSEEDVQLRSKEGVLIRLVSQLIVLTVIVCEPFFCDVFFAGIGGHFLFDLSLAVDVVTAVLMDGSGGVDDDDVDEMKKMKVS